MSLAKKFITYTIPSVVSMWVFCIYTMVDGIFVSHGVSELALASVNISMPFINVIFGLSLWLAVGASTMIAVARGRGEPEEANRIFSINFTVLAIMSLVITVVSLLNIESLATFLGATEHTHDYVVSYLGIIIAFNGCFILSYCLEVLVKADGFPILATVCMCIGAVTNIGLDYLLVIKIPMGVAGAAIATGISQLISLIIFLIHFLSKKSNIRFVKFKFDLSIYKTILPLGLSDCLTEISTGVTVFLYNFTLIKLIGDSGIVAYTIISYISNLVLMTMIGISQGMQPLVSFAYGENNQKHINRLYKFGIVATVGSAIFVFAVSYLFSNQLVGIFIDKSEIELFNFSVEALRKYSFSYLLMGFNVVTLGFFTAIQKPRYSFTISILRGVVLIPVGIITSILLFGTNSVWYATFISELLCLFATIYFIYKYRKE